MRRAGTLALLLALATPGWVAAQGFRVRVDSRFQHVAYRGMQLDSIPLGDVVDGPTGGPVTPDGIAASCSAAPWCYFWRPGAEEAGSPWATTVDGTMWGLGVPGLSVTGRARTVVDLSRSNAWPGSSPPAQLVEGYAEYARRWLSARLGRQYVMGRLGATGFDGGRATLRYRPLGIEASGYGGWSLARGAVVPLTSPAANPLDEYRPTERLVVAGAHLGWRSTWADVRVEYEREVDPSIDKFTAERAAASMAVRPVSGLSLSAGGEYDLSYQAWGSADGAVRWSSRLVDVTLGARRYRPFFPLWTIWGAFSPIGHDGGYAALRVSPFPGVQLRGRYDRYAYEDAHAETPLVSSRDDGWRGTVGGSWRAFPTLTLDLDLHAEEGPGANSAGWQGGATWVPNQRLSITGYGGSLVRPLEYRYDDTSAWQVGVDATWRPTPVVELGAGLARVNEDRDRPDAAAFDWSQTRVMLRASYLLTAGGADRLRPPAGGTP